MELPVECMCVLQTFSVRDYKLINMFQFINSADNLMHNDRLYNGIIVYNKPSVFIIRTYF